MPFGIRRIMLIFTFFMYVRLKAKFNKETGYWLFHRMDFCFYIYKTNGKLVIYKKCTVKSEYFSVKTGLK